MIRFDQVSKMYKGTAKPALNSIDLEILRGEFVFLVGASGSGKSSFLRLVLKEDRPTSGNIHVLGQDLGSISSRKVPYFRRNLGVVFQDFRLLPNKNVFDNVAFTLQVIGKSRGFIQEAVPDVLAMVGLAEKAGRLPHELSGGEQQRVAIARAVVNKPAILLADEPTGNLDPVTSAGIMNVLDRINAGGTTIIMATHDNAIVDQMQRRVVELVSGQVVRDDRQGGYGTTTEISFQDSGMTAEITRPDPLSLRMQATGAIERPVLPVSTHTSSVPVSAPASAPVSALVGVIVADPLDDEPFFFPPADDALVETAPDVRGHLDAQAAADHPEPVTDGGQAAEARQAAEGAQTAELSQSAEPAEPAGDPLMTGQISLAEKLGLRAPGEREDPTADQNVGRTS